MIKHIIFDLDGVLVDAKELHRDIFIHACYKNGVIVTQEQHDNDLCGLPTKTKLCQLGVTDLQFVAINDLKQQLTADRLNDLPKDRDLIQTLWELQNDGLLLSCASNSTQNSVIIVLHRLGIKDFFTSIVSSSDVLRPKPSPEMYYKCMLRVGKWIPETLVIEDSPVGAAAILAGGCNGYMVANRKDVTLEGIRAKCSTF